MLFAHAVGKSFCFAKYLEHEYHLNTHSMHIRRLMHLLLVPPILLCHSLLSHPLYALYW